MSFSNFSARFYLPAILAAAALPLLPANASATVIIDQDFQSVAAGSFGGTPADNGVAVGASYATNIFVWNPAGTNATNAQIVGPAYTPSDPWSTPGHSNNSLYLNDIRNSSSVIPNVAWSGSVSDPAQAVTEQGLLSVDFRVGYGTVPDDPIAGVQSFRIRFGQADTTGNFIGGLGNTNASTNGQYAGWLNFNGLDGTIQSVTNNITNSATKTLVIGDGTDKFELDTNYHLEISFNATSKTWQATLAILGTDGVLGEAKPLALADNPTQASFDFLNQARVSHVDTVHFLVGDGNVNHANAFIDNIKLEAIPEPATLGLLSLGGVLLLRMRHR